ncbi:TPM domain-containing protein [Paraburkholderia sacchari]|uniref:TPM domain-containing protein n=1 Tax=Paraburkholderia sacchari TaxID=159450 RepID=UPI0005430D4C|nr:YgcG family protein [Paraburkholderia sacchari]NLP63686.1 YgcG family protein [Paraburkholderia sacchari]
MNLVRLAIALIVTVLTFVGTQVRADVAVPSLTSRVTDETRTLTDEQRLTLEQTLNDFEAQKGAQISVLIVPTTQPETIEQYSIRVVEQWKLGRKNVDDGVLLIIAKNDRTLRIEVGYGLEGALTDATSNRIIDETIVPRFRQGDFYGGISSGIDSIMHVVNGEPLPAPPERQGSAGGSRGLLPVLLMVTVIAGGILRAVFGRLPGALVTGGLIGLLAWFFSGAVLVAVTAGAIALMFTLLGSGMGAYVGGRFIGGGSGRFGGGSNRDIFRGGGGGFGGGGASGRW